MGRILKFNTDKCNATIAQYKEDIAKIDDHLAHIFGNDAKNLTIAGTYHLLFNGSIMVEEGMGYAICFDNIIHISEDSPLCFRPLSVQVSPQMQLIWKKYQTFTKASQKFLETLRTFLSQ